jgi:hypothetical protein
MAVNNLNTPGVGIQPSIVDAKGDLLVGTAADAISRLGVTGTTGAVLTADAGETTGLKWAAAGSVGGLVHIKTQSVSGALSHSFGSNAAPIFTSDFDIYKIYLVNVTIASGNQDVGFRLRDNTTDQTGSVYQQQNINGSGSGVSASRVTGATSWGVMGADSSGTSGCWIEITNPNNAVVKNGYNTAQSFFSPVQPTIQTKTLVSEDTGTYNGFTIFSSVNLAFTVSVYGYKKA